MLLKNKNAVIYSGGGAHFLDVVVSVSSTALTIHPSTDGEKGSHAQLSFSRRS